LEGKCDQQAAGRSRRELDRLRARHSPEEARPLFIRIELKVKGEEKTGRKLTANAEGAAPVRKAYPAYVGDRIR